MPTLSSKTTPYYGGGQVQNPANVIQVSGAPSSHLTGQGLGTLAVDNAAAKVYSLASKTSNTATWVELGGGTDTYPITPYVVGPTGQAGFQTIQSAINAANTAGGGTIWIQPGTYTENLTIYDKITLCGSTSQVDTGFIKIIGTHTPPNSGTIGFFNLWFVGTSSIFFSTAAGTTSINMFSCIPEVTNGYTFDLVNWTGFINPYDIFGVGTNDGFINNTGGAGFACFVSGFGNGSSNPMIVSGSFEVEACQIACPINFVTGSNFILDNIQLSQPVTCSNNSTGTMDTCHFSTGSSAAITMSSSASVAITTSTITSSNNPSIAGSGAGTLTLGNITFTSNSSISGSLTLAWAPTKTGAFTSSGTITATNGDLVLGTAGNKLSIATGSNASMGTTSAMSGTPGTITVSTTAVTASSKIFISRNTAGGTLGNLSVPTGSISTGTSFVINSDANETSTINWWIVN